MLIDTLFLILGFASVFGVIAGISKDRVYLLPMSGLLILASGMLFFSGTVQYQDGVDIVEEQTSQNVTEISERPVYSSVDENYSQLDFSVILGIILLIISVYSLFIGSDFTNTLRKKE